MADNNNRVPIHILAGPSSTTPNQTSLDIVALHGLGGHWEDSWTQYGFGWLPQSLAPKHPQHRIISINQPSLLADIASDQADFTGLILDLIRERRGSGRTDCPILFICHSFGGIFLKQIYVATHVSKTSNPDFRQLHDSIRGCIYLGTPHQNLHPPDVQKLWRALSSGGVASMGGKSSDLEKVINSTARINGAFHRFGGENLPSVCFYEAEQTLVGLQKMYIVSRAEATFGRPEDVITPLDASHQSMSRYEDSNDNNISRILEAIDHLLPKVDNTLPPPYTPTLPPARRIRLLSLDGGGVKGFWSILILQKIIDEVHRLQPPNRPKKLPCEYFDLIGGTSTGGLLAIMLGRLRMNCASCIHAYRDLSKDVFRRNAYLQFLNPLHTVGSMVLGYPWFSGDHLKSAICTVVRDNLNPDERARVDRDEITVENVLLAPSPPSPSFPVTPSFVCAVPASQRRVQLLRTYPNPNPQTPSSSSGTSTAKYTIWQSARATSAAPMYFPAITIPNSSPINPHTTLTSTTYFDGGLDSNNPIIELLSEATLLYPSPLYTISTTISIGTGRTTVPDPIPPLTNIISHFVSRSTDTEAQHQRVMSEEQFQGVRRGYFRLQGGLELGEIDLADAGKLGEIERLAGEWVGSAEGGGLVRGAAARLVDDDRENGEQ